MYPSPDTVMVIKSVEMKQSSIRHAWGLMINSYKICGWEVTIIMGIEEIICEYQLGSFGSGQRQIVALVNKVVKFLFL